MGTADHIAERVRRGITVRGTVQGVGFRPFVYRLASELQLAGSVRNEGSDVRIRVEGRAAAVRAFVRRLSADAPPLAEVESVDVVRLGAGGDAPEAAGGDAHDTDAVHDAGDAVDRERPDGGFTIVASTDRDRPATRVSPDVATCPDCLRELFDPSDRRHRYPYINCTNCGPRFTIVRGVPYDRPRTTMAAFEMCDACRAEYEDPADRRFHAQPNACPACGPSVRLIDADGEAVATGATGATRATGATGTGPEGPDGPRDPIETAAAALRDGAVVAVKGLGGYHLACRADDEVVVRRLRDRKRREAKPFALAVRDLAAARRLIRGGAEAERLLTDRARPIVLGRRRPDARVADSVAPGHRDLGVMLPYSPLHHLLLDDVGLPLVLTSGNLSDEPIAHLDDDALHRLAGIADLFLIGDRPIHTRTDDSVARVVSVAGERPSRRPLSLRRSRGYAPAPLDLPLPATRPLLACGGELKNTFCLVRGRRAWLGPHIGDLENYETLHSFREGVAHFERLFAVAPEAVAHDLHPEYLSTKYALDRTSLQPVGVQHHHAHLAACLAEHGQTGPAVGAIYDGTGYGTDGTIWGGELLVGGLETFERVGHLHPVRMPGGAAAIRQPWRMACAWLAAASGDAPALPDRLAGRVDAGRWRAVVELVRSGVASPWTTSAGRLFDAVAALCGLHARVSYEGQAAIALEAAVDDAETGAYPLPVRGAPVVLDAREMIRAVMSDLSGGEAVGAVAARFHNGLADATAAACATAADRHGIEAVVLSGGVFQNVRLLERTAARLAGSGLRVLVPRRLPPNDGGLAYGQAAVAAVRMARGGSWAPVPESVPAADERASGAAGRPARGRPRR